MSSSAVLFDVDGTLVDSNYLHVHAWTRAFAEEGIDVAAWRTHRCIGMDGSALVDVLTGGVDEDVAARLKDLHSRFYRETAPLMKQLPGARALLDRVEQLGLQVVLATSAPEDELELLRRVLDSEDVFSAVTSGEDVDTAKPEPGIVEIALQRAGVGTEKAVFVGDAVWDVEACERADVPCIGLMSGGVSRGELENAGARAVFEDAQELLEHLHSTRIGELAKGEARHGQS
ncbi:HAD family hydrolase [Mycobacterium sp. MS1601]|uniref:HAD family hydrolase n=1 Tax=Mycobacterium sp. MS1601 TaxID=1936029 RepID=UPI000979480D|nr:HAD family hydrolase [Mycobacterium sp. MS1601]AQA03452.1 HAD family hydrolase [Mycobacterium sp. MS1601]